ncbi:hypothetical protein N7489_004822 [Penicillium chrysogenum]|uniref:Extracellular membrane protein CFEM domain-containing protein n=1 Tax=Penicillium chrysogenum TaxID=5076 RepID=A0ABQ8WDG2_PENCH|nr:uncharacterized protein N7489_004822 [Penicillium chrysogenum]KAJ5244726.1 hypothetical protein N7489_004822 [Penicillium chrysogenum]KAJ5264647.1 hypothetical protein N7505_007440 [Penicillium chrysogenum]
MRISLALFVLPFGLVSAASSLNPPDGQCYKQEVCQGKGGKALSTADRACRPTLCERYTATYDQDGNLAHEECFWTNEEVQARPAE